MTIQRDRDVQWSKQIIQCCNNMLQPLSSISTHSVIHILIKLTSLLNACLSLLTATSHLAHIQIAQQRNSKRVQTWKSLFTTSSLQFFTMVLSLSCLSSLFIFSHRSISCTLSNARIVWETRLCTVLKYTNCNIFLFVQNTHLPSRQNVSVYHIPKCTLALNLQKASFRRRCLKHAALNTLPKTRCLKHAALNTLP